MCVYQVCDEKLRKFSSDLRRVYLNKFKEICVELQVKIGPFKYFKVCSVFFYSHVFRMIIKFDIKR